MEKKTPLYENHLAAGGKMVPFAGYLMPVQYADGVIAEHNAVRQKAGLFDVSHMGEALVKGPGGLAFLQKLLTNDMQDLAVGGCRYSLMCYEDGGVVDDLIVYRLGEEEYFLVINAANREKDIEWMRRWAGDDMTLEDVSDSWAELALQGPLAEEILDGLTQGGKAALPEKNYTLKTGVQVAGVSCIASRTGYTGEDGFELYCAAGDAQTLWQALLAAGKDKGLVPCGLGARDTLRLEAGMPLYGHEMSESITPVEAVLGFAVKMDKPDFIGKAALEEKKSPPRRRSSLKITGRGIAREGSPVYVGQREVGVVTSGTMLPWLGWAGAMAMLDVDVREIGTQLEVDVRGRRIPAEVIKSPFYKRG